MRYEREAFVEAPDGTRLFYGVAGQGAPTIVLADGIGCDGFAWRYLLPQLAKRHRVVHSHYRGHGRSGPPIDARELGVSHLARDLRIVCDHLGEEEVVLIGHSMGTQVALEYYRETRSKVAALVLMCGAFGRITQTFHGTDALHHMLPRMIGAAQSQPRVARAVWGRIPAGIAFRLARMGGEIDGERIREEDFRRYWEHAALMDPQVFLQMLQQAGEHSAEDLLPHIKVPTLVLAAERDTFTPMVLAEEMAAAIPGAELERVVGASHAAPVEQPDYIAQRVERFLDQYVRQPNQAAQ